VQPVFGLWSVHVDRLPSDRQLDIAGQNAMDRTRSRSTWSCVRASSHSAAARRSCSRQFDALIQVSRRPARPLGASRANCGRARHRQAGHDSLRTM